MDNALNVLVLVEFSDSIMEQLKSISPRLKFTRKAAKSAGDVPGDVWAEVDILYTGSILPEPDAAPRLRWVQSHNAGVEGLLAQPLMASGGVLLTSVSGIHATTMAEYTFAMMLALARKIPTMFRYQAKAEWPSDRFTALLPRELRGSTIGILGYGSIGREIARVAQVFGMEVLATKRNVMQPAATNEYALPDTGDPEGTLVSRLYPPEATRSMVALCDFVVIAAPLTSRTTAIVNADVLSAMKRTAYLINVARGGLVDEEALITALREKKIAGAALDVFSQEPLPASSPLWELDNLIISPHISGNTSHYNESAAEVFAENLERYLNHRDLLNLVDRTRGY
ncbi:MAG TPA: D-2-hydroxyacid dehydrogenase [Aggregatilineales bacterium]|nr:D-2-hydroxyacid dehydrogenase [Aggregatilineales bacterium]